jgi:predicted aconitase with swiveling domain
VGTVSSKALKGRVINGGVAKGEAIVLNVPFSFIGDFNPLTGVFSKGHPMEGASLAGKILVCSTGKGGTVAPYVAYEAMKRHTAPVAILCQRADPILALSAITIDIPMMDRFEGDITEEINTGDRLQVDGNRGVVNID